MAEPISLASGLLTLASFAFQCSVSLYETARSFRSHQQRVKDLVEELNALSAVLGSLSETANSLSDIDFSALKIPLLRCGNACKDFEQEIIKCSSRSSNNRTSFRDWAKLRYMGDDVDGFRRSLASYKLTISIALTDAHLRKSSATTESLEIYNDLLDNAKANLEDRLEGIDEKLELIVGSHTTKSEPDVSELRLIREERLSTVKCLEICAQLSQQISQIQVMAKKNDRSNEQSGPDTVSERITIEGLQECKSSLAQTTLKLEGYEKQLFNQILDRSKNTNISEHERADIARLRDELVATRQGMSICSRAHEHLKENVSIIDNYATGDAVQFMVSTSEKTIHGKNQGLGWRTRQVGGHISDESLQQIARSLAGVTITQKEPRNSSLPSESRFDSDTDVGSGRETGSRFTEQYGKGFNFTVPLGTGRTKGEPSR